MTIRIGTIESRHAIGWCHETFNPGLRGCSHAGTPECDRCYAPAVADRLVTFGQPAYAGVTRKLSSGLTHWNGEVRVDDEETMAARIRALPRARTPRRVFATSMSDWAHDAVPLAWIVRMVREMAAREDRIWLLLTKRAARLPEVAEAVVAALGGWPPHVQPGVTVGHPRSLWRLPYLLRVPDPAVRWVSAEPLLAPLNLTHMDVESHPAAEARGNDLGWYQINALTGRNTDMARPCPDAPRIHQVVVGCESGSGRRPTAWVWAEDLRRQCREAGTAFFLKQLDVDGRVVARPEMLGRRWIEVAEHAKEPTRA